VAADPEVTVVPRLNVLRASPDRIDDVERENGGTMQAVQRYEVLFYEFQAWQQRPGN
jgi:hypothetical protein